MSESSKQSLSEASTQEAVAFLEMTLGPQTKWTVYDLVAVCNELRGAAHELVAALDAVDEGARHYDRTGSTEQLAPNVVRADTARENLRTLLPSPGEHMSNHLDQSDTSLYEKAKAVVDACDHVTLTGRLDAIQAADMALTVLRDELNEMLRDLTVRTPKRKGVC